MKTNIKNNTWGKQLKTELKDMIKDFKTTGEVYGSEDGSYHIIYTDGSETTIFVDEYNGEKIKLTDIKYIRYLNGWGQYDSLNGEITDWYLGLTEDNRERYDTNIEIIFGTEWGAKQL